MVRCAFPSWDEIYLECKKIAKMIHAKKYKPDVVIALSRGGFIPARTLCDLLIVKDLISIKVDHWGITATKNGNAELRYPIQTDLSSKHVLVVDDITDTGESLALATKFIREHLKPAELKTAVIYHINHSKFLPDFFAREIQKEDWVWVVWPWNFVEDMCNLLSKDMDGKMKLEQIKEKFETVHHANISLQLLSEALDALEGRLLVKRNADGTWERI